MLVVIIIHDRAHAFVYVKVKDETLHGGSAPAMIPYLQPLSPLDLCVCLTVPRISG